MLVREGDSGVRTVARSDPLRDTAASFSSDHTSNKASQKKRLRLLEQPEIVDLSRRNVFKEGIPSGRTR